MAGDRLTRRSLFGMGAAAMAATSFGMPRLAKSELRRGKVAPARNVIVMVSDGMSVGVPSMLSQYMSMTRGELSPWHRAMLRDDVSVAHMDTTSLNSLVTDSAAAGSAWGCGSKVFNGAINTLPDGTELTPILSLIKGLGKRTGLVTTTRITHATPASYSVSEPNRSGEDSIALKQIANDVDVLFGGGARHFDPESRSDGRDVFGEAAGAGYAVSRTRAEFNAQARSGKHLGLFAGSSLPYHVDHLNDAELRATIPSIKEMTEVAVGALSGGPGFVLQVEGARIDHAAHGNDFAGVIYDQLAFEEALEWALDWADRDGETLVIVTTDHGNASPAISGNSGYGDGNGLLTLDRAKSSFEGMAEEFESAGSALAIQDLIEDRLDIQLTTQEAEVLLANDLLQMFPAYDGRSQLLAMVLGNHTGVGWSSGSHTSDWVPVTAFGPGSDAIADKFMDNTDLFDLVCSANDVTFENPSMTFEEAQASASIPTAEEDVSEYLL